MGELSVPSIQRYLAQLESRGFVGATRKRNTVTNLTEAEYIRLRKACAGEARDSSIIELLLQTGIRLSELARLKIIEILSIAKAGLTK